MKKSIIKVIGKTSILSRKIFKRLTFHHPIRAVYRLLSLSDKTRVFMLKSFRVN